MAEATETLEELLRLPPIKGDIDGNNLQRRSTCEYFVVRGNEKTSLLCAPRTDNTTGLECLHFEVSNDFTYNVKGKPHMARSRMSKVSFKQNVGHLCKDITFLGAHGHMRTMKLQKPKKHREWFDKLCQLITHWKVKFVAGDFNMSFTQVPELLRNRGMTCDLIAWYPWQQPFVSSTTFQSTLGLDS